MVEYFEKSDYKAAQEYFDPSKISFFKPDFDTQAEKVVFKSKTSDEGAREVLSLVDVYSINQQRDSIGYPAGGIGFNSNSWAQTVISLAGGKAISDFDGIDVGNDKRIPKTYFDPICLIKPRPKVN